MNKKKIIAQLKSQYPGKDIIQLPPENPVEIICEVDPTSEHPEKSVAIAVIESSYPHFHRNSEETYKVLKGKLRCLLEMRAIL